MVEQKPIKDFTLLNGPGQIGSLAHADRLAILRALGEEPRTGADIARELDLPANRVHYHLKQLLEHELVVEVGKGRKLWKEERLFRSASRHYVVDPGLGGESGHASDTLKASIENAFLDLAQGGTTAGRPWWHRKSDGRALSARQTR